ncbi:type I methionyl aminopeptidase [Chloroflexota bacterium]
MAIIIKSAAEIAIMRNAGRIVAEVLKEVTAGVRPGVTTKELDVIAEIAVKRLGGRPSFKGYMGYPASLCVSVNEEIVHGIPGPKKLLEGDIVSLDFGAVYDSFQGDAAITVAVGDVSPEATGLIEATKGALKAAIAQARHGNRLGDISAAVQGYAEPRGYGVVREYTGHGIGREMHEEPQVLNYGKPGTGVVLKEGMTICIEPMLNFGVWETRRGDDGWTVSTADGKLSAHFEHSIAITDGDAEVLTRL